MNPITRPYSSAHLPDGVEAWRGPLAVDGLDGHVPVEPHDEAQLGVPELTNLVKFRRTHGA